MYGGGEQSRERIGESAAAATSRYFGHVGEQSKARRSYVVGAAGMVNELQRSQMELGVVSRSQSANGEKKPAAIPAGNGQSASNPGPAIATSGAPPTLEGG